MKFKSHLVGMIGDLHGNTAPALHKIDVLYHLGVQNIVQLGDFGLFPHRQSMEFIDKVHRPLKDHDQRMYAVRGNHDSDAWEQLLECGRKDDVTGGAYLTSNIILLPRTGIFRLAEMKFGVAGGAVSIDRAHRIEGYSWWPEEQLTDEEAFNFPNEKVDVLVSHDCSDKTPFGKMLVPDLLSQIHRMRIDEVLRRCRPEMHFHGHMHKKYEWSNPVGDGQWTQTFGLDCDGQPNSLGVLDTREGSFEWF